MKPAFTGIENEDGTYSLLLYGKEIIRGEYEDVRRESEQLGDTIASTVGSTLGIGLGFGVGFLASAVNPFFLLLIPAEIIAISLLLARAKSKEGENHE